MRPDLRRENRFVVDFTARGAEEAAEKVVDDFVRLVSSVVLDKFGYQVNLQALIQPADFDTLIGLAQHWHLDGEQTITLEQVLGHPILVKYFLAQGIQYQFEIGYEEYPEHLEAQMKQLIQILKSHKINPQNESIRRDTRKAIESSQLLHAFIEVPEGYDRMSNYTISWLEALMSEAMTNPHVAALLLQTGHFEVKRELTDGANLRTHKPSVGEYLVPLELDPQANPQTGLELIKSSKRVKLGVLLGVFTGKARFMLVNEVFRIFSGGKVGPEDLLMDDRDQYFGG